MENFIKISFLGGTNLEPIEVFKKLIWLSVHVNQIETFQLVHSVMDNEVRVYEKQFNDAFHDKLVDYIREERIEFDIQNLLINICRLPNQKSYLKISDVVELNQENFINYLSQDNRIPKNVVILFFHNYRRLDMKDWPINQLVIDKMKEEVEKTRDIYILFFVVDIDDFFPQTPFSNYAFCGFLLNLFTSIQELKDFLNPEYYVLQKERARMYLSYVTDENISEDMKPQSFTVKDSSGYEFFEDTIKLSDLQGMIEL